MTSTDDAGAGSLRQAIADANANAGADTIDIPVTGTIGLDTPLPVIVDETRILGSGETGLTVRRADAAGPFRVFTVNSAEASISDLTIANGREASSAFAEGGGIGGFEAVLTLSRVTVTGNSAIGDSPAAVEARGGGIYLNGALTILNSTVAGNTVDASGGDSALAEGGGILVDGPGTTLLIRNSTISGNSAVADASANIEDARGGGAVIGEDGVIENSTVSGNSVSTQAQGATATAEGGGIWSAGALEDLNTLRSVTVTGNSAADSDATAGANLHRPMQLRNSIVANPSGEPSCGGTSPGFANASLGHNLDEDGSCGLAATGDLDGVDPALGPLAANGGNTRTHLPAATSPAVDAGTSAGLTSDQRGLTRPVDQPTVANAADGADIGAVERAADPGPEPEPEPGPEPDEPEFCKGERATIKAQPGVLTEGTDGPDVIVGTPEGEEIHGLEGDDLVCARGGRDLVLGGEGDDHLIADGGEDRVSGGTGDDRINSGGENDKSLGGKGRDIVRGGEQNDALRGGKGRDNMHGHSGKDVVRGGPADDRLDGGEGADEMFGGKGVDLCRRDPPDTRSDCETNQLLKL